VSGARREVREVEGHIDMGGVRLWYGDAGSAVGPPVLLVMGVDASALWWPPPLIEALVGAGHRVVRFDNRDIGLSTHVDFEAAPYGVDDMVADALGLLDALHIQRAHLVGVSVGGVLGQLAALRHPDRVASLTLVSSTPGPDERLSGPTGALLAFFNRPRPPERDWARSTLEFCRVLSGSRFPFDEGHYRELIAADLARGTNPDCHHGELSPAPSRVDALATIRAPTLVIHGTEDPLFPFDHAEAMAGAMSGATLVPWRGVGHEQPPPLVPEWSRLLIEHIGAAT
jgi:pimeloyl-ACP methyl ester carboxylesterase